MKKSALITGITGQDGAYLSDLLIKKGYKVYGTYREEISNFWRLDALKIKEKINLIPADITNKESLLKAIKISKPDEIYNLAAQSHIQKSFEKPILTAEAGAIGPLILLEIIKDSKRKIKFYQASTSELYGEAKTKSQSQNEESPFLPTSPYAIAKLYAFHTTKLYREVHGIFACNGILFNHESPLRGLDFLTRKVTNAVARIKLGLQDKLVLGNMSAKRDWGFAPDYVESMWLMLQQEKPDDYVIATGQIHSVKDFVIETFKVAGIQNWENYVESNDKLKRPHDTPHSKGDYSKAKKKLGWSPKVDFKNLVKKMYEADLSRWKRHQKGETFPWDVKTSPKL